MLYELNFLPSRKKALNSWNTSCFPIVSKVGEEEEEEEKNKTSKFNFLVGEESPHML